jgi:hydrogenase expression/formation protein HypE
MRDAHKREAEKITLAHGSGGRMMQRLIKEVFLRYFDSRELAKLDDAAELIIGNSRLAFSTDTFVVKPIFFSGGDIGSLAVSGTVNDVLMKGGCPLHLSLGFVIEEGFPMQDLTRILESIRATAKQAEVSVVTGDTKVVGRGEADGIFINTTGLGAVLPGVRVGGRMAKVGDAIIVSGDIGAHGIAVMAERNGLRLSGDIRSDAAPLNRAVLPLLERFRKAVHVLRDPTRGGTATSLNEIAVSSKVSITLHETAVPISEPVGAVCDVLGLDPLYLPCEGRFLAFVDPAVADDVLSFLQDLEECSNASKIGEVEGSSSGEVQLVTAAGGKRLLDVPAAELLPRIC